MPVYLAPFGFVLGLLVLGYGVKRPRSELADDRQRSFGDIGWGVKPIAFLPVPLARAVWVLLGLMIIAGSVVSVV